MFYCLYNTLKLRIVLWGVLLDTRSFSNNVFCGSSVSITSVNKRSKAVLLKTITNNTLYDPIIAAVVSTKLVELQNLCTLFLLCRLNDVFTNKIQAEMLFNYHSHRLLISLRKPRRWNMLTALVLNR